MTRAQVAARYPSWVITRGTDMLCHGARPDVPGMTATGESWEDLADQITRSEALESERRYRLATSPVSR